ncbi:hypothetical protein ACLBWX_16405 [Methylobacterium sp. M6A4_1b]
MSSFFSSDGSFPLQFAIIFVVIFLVLAAGVFLIRRFGGKGSPLSGKNTPRGRQPRLGIVDIYELDRQRQLILLRRDNVEHLLLVGGPNDVVIERNILRGMSARLAAEETPFDEAPEPVLNPMPEPPVTQQAPLPSLAPVPPPVPPYREPSFEMPVTVAPGIEVASQPPEVARGRGAVPEPGPSLTVSDPAVPPRPRDSQLARVIRRTPPTLANLVPAAIAERVGLAERGSEAEPAPARDAQSSAAPPPVVPAPAARAIDAAILSDMARQLEEALRRPSAAVRPAATDQSAPGEPDRPPAAPQSPGRVESQPQPEPTRETLAGPPGIDPMAAAMAATAQAPAFEERAVEPEPATDDALFAEHPEIRDLDVASAEPPVLQASAPAQPPPIFRASMADAAKAEAIAPPEVPPATIEAPPAIIEAPPAFIEQRPAAAPTQPPSPPAPAKAPATPNPFSVEEIEAEFARLLGRPLDRKQ